MSSKSPKNTVSQEEPKSKNSLSGIENPTDYLVYGLLQNKGPLTRAQLVKLTKIARTTLYDALMRLEYKKYVTQYIAKPEGRPGRPKEFFMIKNA